MKSLEAVFGPNFPLVEELYNQYQTDATSVPPYWRDYFDEMEGKAPSSDTGSRTVAPASVSTRQKPPTQAQVEKAVTTKEIPIPATASLEKIKGVSAKIAENMDESIDVPTATSLRVLPMKMLSEDRTLINNYLIKNGEPKASFTHFIAWAVIQALKEYPNLNSFYGRKDKGHYRVIPEHVNLGIAVDVEGKNGERNLVVPNIKAVDTMNFKEFLHAYADVVRKARTGTLAIEDFKETTISVTNPGTLGTISSVPRLMKGQGAIIATGAINYPAEFQSMSQEVLNHLGVSKVMTMTCTYDHRIIQGAESGSFLKKIGALLNGEEDFFDSIFKDLDIPYEPMPFGNDKFTGQLSGNGTSLENDRRAISVWRLINMYRMRGHVLADLDPLENKPGHSPELDLDYYGLTLWDLDREFFCDGLGGLTTARLRDILALLRETYCGKIGAEYMHLLDLEERKWLREYMESTTNKPALEKNDKESILHKLNQAMAFEQFLHKKYIGHKRFSLEGADTLIPMMHFLMERAGELDIDKFYLGMAHRGRLNILVNVMNKPYHKVFADFEGNIDPASIQGSGDVKYHLGSSGYYDTDSGKTIELELLPNPSHLESVNPVVEGAARSHQDLLLREWYRSQASADKADEGGEAVGEAVGEAGGETDGKIRPSKKIVPVLIHGDAAFAGQGVVAETLNMSQLKGYNTGGTIHIIINNQIGFTTLPTDARSTEYASDIAKMILAPIFHVNGDNPEEAVHSIQMALDYRQTFGKDVVIDLICFRKHGHNEGDEPGFTQPGMYREIEGHETVRDLYMRELLRKREFTEEEVQEIFQEFDDLLQKAFEDAKSSPALEITEKMLDRVERTQKEWDEYPDTTYSVDDLQEIAVKLNTVPAGFDANPKLLRQLAKRAEIVQKNEKKIDWGFAEALALGSLLKSGKAVRLTGQDVERGTFSHRHAVLHGTETEHSFTPLNHLSESQGHFYPYNSHLSEFAALGFEFGYSAANPDALVIWEAQFGDFANGAQIIIDQYISSSEAKWGQRSGLVMTLPHGYEGQGPEHSSARLERFLQLCAEDNMQVMNLTSPAQYYHALRKQVLQEKKRPMIIMSPKSLLRHPQAVCSVKELSEGSFQPFIDDVFVENKENITRLVVCSGKVYYDLLKQQKDREKDGKAGGDIAIARLEQLYPFPNGDIKRALTSYKNLKEVVWCQEEPGNMGGWMFVQPRLSTLLKRSVKLKYAGRQASASPAAGQKKIHDAEQQRLLDEALS